MLSDLRQGAARPDSFRNSLNYAGSGSIKKPWILSTLDKCFRVIGQKPVNTKGRLHEVFGEDFRRELAEIESKEGRRLFVLAKANHQMHLRIAEYEILIAAAALTGHYGVGAMLESALRTNWRSLKGRASWSAIG